MSGPMELRFRAARDLRFAGTDATGQFFSEILIPRGTIAIHSGYQYTWESGYGNGPGGWKIIRGIRAAATSAQNIDAEFDSDQDYWKSEEIRKLKGLIAMSEHAGLASDYMRSELRRLEDEP